jgi:hypothetical protein
MAPRRPGIGGQGRQRIEAALTYYVGSQSIKNERERDKTLEDERSSRFRPSSLDDISPWYPEQQHGSNESSRVLKFKFVPSATEDEKLLGTRYGTVFVRFIKNKTPWKYMNVPLNVYESFAASPSKGKFINQVLNNYSYSRVTAPDELSTYFTDI